MRFLLMCVIVVLVASCGGGKSSMMSLDDTTTTIDTQLMAEFNKQMAKTWEPDVAPITRFDEETRILYWCLRGDYDLSGEVNLSDITPIAQYFGQEVDEEINPSLINGAPWWVDGDQNGEITISDITPIAQNFQERAFWWFTSIGWGQPVGGYGGMFYVHVPEVINPSDVVINISDLPSELEGPSYPNFPPMIIVSNPPNPVYSSTGVPKWIIVDVDSEITLSVYAQDVNEDMLRFEWELQERIVDELGSQPIYKFSKINDQIDVNNSYSQVTFKFADTRLNNDSYLRSTIRVYVYDIH